MDMQLLKEKIKASLIGRSVCHDYQHALHVEAVAIDIAQNYPEANRDEVSATALLHDVWDHKFVDDPALTQLKYMHTLRNAGFDSAAIERICENIELLSWSKGKTPKTLEGKIVQDADRVTGIGATGVLRAATYSVHAGGRSFDETVQHLVDKCLLLKDSLNFPESKAMAQEGHNFLVQFIELYKKESFF